VVVSRIKVEGLRATYACSGNASIARHCIRNDGAIALAEHFDGLEEQRM
jgi:hypothetical protein